MIKLFGMIKDNDRNELRIKIDESFNSSNKKISHILQRNPTINTDQYKESLNEMKEYIKRSIHK